MSDGKLRRSALVGVYGPGAIVDMRAEKSKAPISGLIAGLEEWDGVGKGNQKGKLHPQFITEPRLQEVLGVEGFRLPPIKLNTDKSDFDVLPVVRFPRWLQCPQCHRIGMKNIWGIDPGSPAAKCARCSQRNAPVHAVPVRFIVACEKGHLDEFPWKMWAGCRCENPRLYLRMSGPGLSGKFVRCENPTCEGKARSLDGIFRKDALSKNGLKCRGHKPWLATQPESCSEMPRVLQRGASNVYWGKVLSALDIPPFSGDLSDVFGSYWSKIKEKSPENWPALIDILELDKETGLPKEELLERLNAWRNALVQNPDEPLEWREYQQFEEACDDGVRQGEFQVNAGVVPPELSSWFSGVGLAQRLREVRAMVGFTRIRPPSGPFADVKNKLCPIYINKKNWLPGIELRGEGIFIRFDAEKLKAWEQLEPVQKRVSALQRKVKEDLYEGEELPDCSARLLLLHSFSHAFMRQLSLECGYSSAALVERIYAGRDPYEMSGVLIHTGSVDAEGTLGGLVRQGKKDLLGGTIKAALSSMAWCSSDPLCITGAATLSSPRNASACHACLLVPETSCQHFNVLLDRALLVGTPGDKTIGFFHDMVDNA